ncbi:hypothetical protein Micbo1qcDRAFT_44680 [Microdochium bolleyi]|uniref:Uncharacterized protein n=1 Tax=Microdochium bolleyi TaxID=196109 RepID=A0A136JBK6_9PEZI|nr:hypothetical protein Micbo1qcDRAFT_44680 [Microdochium bolleyi]
MVLFFGLSSVQPALLPSSSSSSSSSYNPSSDPTEAQDRNPGVHQNTPPRRLRTRGGPKLRGRRPRRRAFGSGR